MLVLLLLLFFFLGVSGMKGAEGPLLRHESPLHHVRRSAGFCWIAVLRFFPSARFKHSGIDFHCSCFGSSHRAHEEDVEERGEELRGFGGRAGEKRCRCLRSFQLTALAVDQNLPKLCHINNTIHCISLADQMFSQTRCRCVNGVCKVRQPS